MFINQLKAQMEKELMYKNIFKYDTYVPPFIHLADKDKFSVHKMGQVFERYNQVEPLVLFDK